MKNTFLQIFLFVLLSQIIACGGGGKDNQDSPSDSFKNLCESPRTGTDPFNNNQPYPDKKGSTLDENNWLRSWSNETYLWYDEIIDRDPADYDNPLEYFSLLKTEDTTPSGNPKDNFHFTAPTQEYQQSTRSGISTGFGARFIITKSRPPRRVAVGYTEPGTTAAANLSRGTEILSVNGIDIVNGNTQAIVDLINSALFAPQENTSYEFVVRDLGDNQNRTVNMTASQITLPPVKEVKTINTDNGKIGYFLFNSHIQTAEAELIDAVNQLANEDVNDLILDLRYNGGGLLAIASQLAYMIAEPSASLNKTFGLTTFNDKNPTTNPVTGSTINPTPFYSTSLGFSVSQGQELPNLGLNRVFILSTARTCSASEAIINGLRGIDIEVILIGSTTCGKPYGFYPTDNCGTTYFTIQFSEQNDKGFGDYADGFSPIDAVTNVGESIPGCSIVDDYSNPLGDSQEAQLAAALYYVENGSCPVGLAQATTDESNQNKNLSGLSLFDSKVYQNYILLRENSFYH